MKSFEIIIMFFTALFLTGCNQNDAEFRLGFFWASDEPTTAANVISADDLIKIDVKKRLALMRANDRLDINPIKKVTEAAVFEYYQIPPNSRAESHEKTNFGYVWIKPFDSVEDEWTNTQLWVKSSALTKGATPCNNIGSDEPLVVYLSISSCESQPFDICDETIPKFGIMYDDHYDLVLFSTDPKTIGLCEKE